MRIIRYTEKQMGEQSTKEMKYAYTCGMFSADGTYSVLKTSIATVVSNQSKEKSFVRDI